MLKAIVKQGVIFLIYFIALRLSRTNSMGDIALVGVLYFFLGAHLIILLIKLLFDYDKVKKFNTSLFHDLFALILIVITTVIVLVLLEA